VNIFYFYECPVLSAIAQPDKMLVKMPLETAQMLCTAHRELDGDEYADANGLYKRAYWNHPCNIWARETSGNYNWLYKHFISLCNEYQFRYGRQHASLIKLEDVLKPHPVNITIGDMTPLAQAMPEEYKHANAIVAYRNYCINEKHYAKWERGRTKPFWWTTEEAA
tara:strand:+ start:189 stop:686 length:498 start_codon:yes stop_codon:yes gene_type:complete